MTSSIKYGPVCLHSELHPFTALPQENSLLLVSGRGANPRTGKLGQY